MYNDYNSDPSEQGSINFQSLDQHTLQAAGDSVALPQDSFIRDAEFAREGNDLILKGPDGEIVVEGYFAAVPTPNLIAPSGLTLTPQLVDSFTQSPLKFADAGGATASDESPVGAVSEVNGEAHVTRMDGTVEPVQIGTPIYQGDIVETNAEGAINIMFIDETSFAVSEDARLSIDEYVFDPATSEGSTNFSVLKGMFVFTSGLIGREDPDDVMIETPQGSIGIRGTIIAGDVTNGEITVVEGAIVLRDFSGNEMTLAVQFETARFNSMGGQIENMGQMQAADVAAKFSPISGVSGNLFSSINDVAGENGNEPSQDPAGEEAGANDQGPNAQNAGEGEPEPMQNGGADGEPQSQDMQQQPAPDGEPIQDGAPGDGEPILDGEPAPNDGTIQDGSAPDDGGGDATLADGTTPDGTDATTGTAGSTADGGSTDGTQTTQTTQTSTTQTTNTTGSGFESGSLDTTAQTSGTTSTTSGTSGTGGTTTATSGTSGSGGTTTTSGTTTQTTTNTNNTTTTTTTTEPPPPTALDGTDGTGTVADAPSFIWTHYSQIAENATAGTAVATLGLSAAEAAGYSFSIVGGDPGSAFAIDGLGEITVATASPADYETTTSQTLTIQVVQDGVNLGNFDTIVLYSDVNEFTPVVDAGAATAASVSESAASGTLVETIAATDGDASAVLTYNITGGNADGVFTINDSGQIHTTTGALDYELGGVNSALAYNLTIEVSDGTNTDTHSIIVNITDFDEPSVASANTVSGFEDTARTFVQADFTFTDPESAAMTHVIFETVPSNGTIFLDNDADGTVNAGDTIIAAGNDVALADITAGNLKFIGASDENGTGYDIFSFAVSTDGGTTYGTDATMTIDLTAINDETFITTNTGTSVSEGGSTTLTTSMLNVTDVDDVATDIYYTASNEINGSVYVLGSPSTSFTHQDIIDGNVTFVHDGSETASASFDISVIDGGEDGAPADTGTFNLTVSATDDAPIITNAGGSGFEGQYTVLTVGMLDASDIDTPDSGLTFTVSSPLNGHVANVATPGASITTFTQQQLVNGDIVFMHDDSETFTASFDFTVSDGNTTTSSNTFTLSIASVNDVPTFATPIYLAPYYSTGTAAVDLFDITPGDITDGDGGAQEFQSFTIEVSNAYDGVNPADEELVFSGAQVVSISTGPGTITYAGKTLDVTKTLTAADTYTLVFTAQTPGTDELTASELEGLLDSMSYQHNNALGTEGLRTITITEIQDTGGTFDGGVDTLALSYSTTVDVVMPLDIMTLSTGDGFTITDDLGLRYGSKFYAGTDHNGDGFDDLIIGRGKSMLFQLEGFYGTYNDFTLASAPAGHTMIGFDARGSASGSTSLTYVGDVNGDGNIDYIQADPTLASNAGEAILYTGANQLSAYDVDNGGNTTIVDTYVIGNTVYSVLADGQRFVSTAVDGSDRVNDVANLNASGIPAGWTADTYYDSGNGAIITINDNAGTDGSLSIYNTTDGSLINQVTGQADLANAKHVVVVDVGGITSAYITTTAHTLVRIDDIYGTPSAPVTLSLTALESTLNSSQYIPGTISPTNALGTIEALFTNGEDVFVVAARPNDEQPSLIRLNVQTSVDGSAAIDLSYETSSGVNTLPATQLMSLESYYMDESSNLFYAIVRDGNSSKVISTNLTITDWGQGLEAAANGGTTFEINSDTFPSIAGSEQLIYNSTTQTIAVLSRNGTVSEFDVSGGPANPVLISIASNPEYADGVLSYGPNGNLLVSSHDEIYTIDSGSTTSTNLNTPTAGDLTGKTVTELGDINGDGIQDMAFSTPTSGSTGTVTVVMGDDTNSFTDTIQFSNVDHGGDSKIPILDLGDFDGDGVSDIAIGEGGSNRIHVFLGNSIAAGTNLNINDVALKDGSSGQGYTFDLGASSKMLLSGGSAGDFDGDGIDDLIIAVKDPGASNYDVDVFVVFGGIWSLNDTITYDDLIDPLNAFHMTYTIPGTGDADTFDMLLSSAGDLNGDGYNDIAIGTTGVDNSAGTNTDGIGGTEDDNDGTVHVVYGHDVHGLTDHLGTGADDSLFSTASYEIMNGAEGNDTLSQSAITDIGLTMNGGSGNDIFQIISDDLETFTIQGGAGHDILMLQSITDLDFRNVGELGVQRVEEIRFEGATNDTLTLSLENLMNLMSTSDTNSLSITSDGGGTDTLLIDHNGAGSTGGGNVGDIEIALESIFGADNVHHSTDGTSEEFTIGSFELNIDTVLIANTTVADV